MALLYSAGILTFIRTIRINCNNFEQSHGTNLIAVCNCMRHVGRHLWHYSIRKMQDLRGARREPETAALGPAGEALTHARSPSLVCRTLPERRPGHGWGAGERRGSFRATGELSLTPEQY